MRTTETDHFEQPIATERPTLRLLFSGQAGLVGRLYALTMPQTLLGREIADEKGIGLPLDGRASRQHAHVEVSVHSDLAHSRCSVSITDLESKNGTFVNGLPVRHSSLHDGDIIRIGNSFFLLRYEDARRVDADAEPLSGQSPVMRSLRARLVQAAREQQAILILGETGVGKEVAAQAIHRASRRRGPLIAMNCAAIPSELAESQLFGHTAGAFSGARSAHPGFFRAAEGGTLLLDEVGELLSTLQAKLLRALEERAVVPVGATQPIKIDVRIVAATNRNLQKDVAEGRFRPDLYARLCGEVLTLPPLRQRREDILPLLFGALPGDKPPILSARLVEALLLHSWPFNIRELVQLAGVLKGKLREEAVLDLALVAERLQPSPIAPSSESSRSPVRGDPSEDKREGSLLTPEALARLYREHEGNISGLSRLVGLSRRHVSRLLERYGIRDARSEF